MAASSAAKGGLSVELNPQLVERARHVKLDLPATIETLLSRHIDAMERGRRLDEAKALCAASNAHLAEHGFWGEEFSTL
jgi:post-segregation antitoxin (ccd killing protein)